MLDLKTGVNFKEVELITSLVVNKLDSTSTLVVDRRDKKLGSSHHLGSSSIGKVRSRSLLNNLLVTALKRTVTLAKSNGITLTITKNLNLDVTGVLDKSLKENTRVIEVSLTLMLNSLKSLGQVIGITDALQTDTTTTGSRLDHEWVLNLFSRNFGFFNGLNQTSTGNQGDTSLLGNLTSRVLKTQTADSVRRVANKNNAAVFTGFSKVSIFRKETVTRDKGLGAGSLGSINDLVNGQVGLSGGSTVQGNGVISIENMLREAIRLRVNSDSLDAELFEGFDNSNSNFTSVGNQNSRKGLHRGISGFSNV